MTFARSAMRLGSVLLLVLLPACGRQAETPPAADMPDTTSTAVTAVVTLAPTAGNSVQGTLTLTEEAGGVRVSGQLSGLTAGDHGIHLHESGDCSAPDASSAGAHWNPSAMPHGGPDSPQHHAGDLGNVTADASGNATIDRLFPGISLVGDQSIVGKAVVVHASPDDLSTQPAGASGARVACGVIAQQ